MRVFVPPASSVAYWNGTLVIRSVAPVRSAETRVPPSGIGLKRTCAIAGAPPQYLGFASSSSTSSRCHARSTYGPVPIGCSATYASPCSCQNLASAMNTGRVIVGGSGVGRFVTKRTVYGSGVSTRATVSTRGSCCDLYAGSRIFSTVYLTSALVNGDPFENVTPRRSANSHTVGAICFHESASCGSSTEPSGERRASVSKICACTLVSVVTDALIGSSVLTSTPCVIVTVAGSAARAGANVEAALALAASGRRACGSPSG